MSDSLRRLQLQGNFQGNWNLHHYWWECKMVQPRWKNLCQFLKQLNYCCCSVARLFPTFCDPVNCNMPGIPVLQYLPEFAQTHVHWLNDAIQPSHPVSPPSTPALNLSQHPGLFQWVVLPIRWSKDWSFSISPSNEHSRFISLRIDWLDLLAVQRTLKILL